MVRASLVLIAVAACGSPTAPANPTVAPPIDAPLPPLAAECPASYAARQLQTPSGYAHGSV